jgi:hypothetical protein
VNTTTGKYDRELALLLDLPDGDAEYQQAKQRLESDADLRREFEGLQTVAEALGELADDLFAGPDTIDVRDDVRDALVQSEWDELEGNERPFHELESRLDAVAREFSQLSGQVDVLAPVMEAVSASKMTDNEMELPFAPLAEALNLLGDDLAGSVASVDVLKDVMDRIPGSEPAPINVTPLRARPVAAASVTSPNRRDLRPYIGLAAAAALCIVAGWLAFHKDPSLSPENRTTGVGPLAVEIPSTGTNDSDTDFERVVPHIDVTPDLNGQDVVPESDTRPTAEQDGAAPLTLQEAINARRRALLNDLTAFEKLASLSADEASQLLEEMDLSLDAILGAADYLSPEDAAAVLRAAVANEPENESLRYALAQSLEGDTAHAAEREEHLENLAAQAPTNSLPHYMLASDYLARGEVDLGMDALSRGAALSEASPYSLESMHQREAVLRASGLDPDVARYLAVTTAGEGEAADIAALRSELLDQGAYYEELGDYDTAQQIYNAVSQLGAQLTESADMASVQLAGLETQRDAMSAIQDIAAILQQPENVALLGGTLSVLSESILDVAQYVNVAQTVVNNPTATSAEWTTLIQHIFSYGDTDIASLLDR